MKPNFTSLLLRFIRCFILIFYKSFLMFVHVTIDKSLFSFIARSRNQYSPCHLDMYLKRHLKDLHVTATKSIIMRSYNQATINIIKMPIHHNQTKHIEINKYFIKNKIDQEITWINYTPDNFIMQIFLLKLLNNHNLKNDQYLFSVYRGVSKSNLEIYYLPS